jgi:Cu+-exporting ATPase
VKCYVTEITQGEKQMATVTDPVCKMEIDSESGAAQSEFQGQTYFFCATECKDKFDANPQPFVTERGSTATP